MNWCWRELSENVYFYPSFPFVVPEPQRNKINVSRNCSLNWFFVLKYVLLIFPTNWQLYQLVNCNISEIFNSRTFNYWDDFSVSRVCITTPFIVNYAVYHNIMWEDLWENPLHGFLSFLWKSDLLVCQFHGTEWLINWTSSSDILLCTNKDLAQPLRFDKYV